LQVVSLSGPEALGSPQAAELTAASPFGPVAKPAPEARLWALEEGGVWPWLAGYAPLAFDSQVFGHNIARLAPLLHSETWPQAEALSQGAALLTHLAGQARSEGVACLMARVDSRDMLAAQALEAAGASLADLSVEWALDLGGLAPPPAPPDGLSLRPWQAEDREALAEMCAASFCDLEAYADRFALDPRLRPGCPELYRRWMQNSLAGEQADQILVLAGEQLAGFITLRLPGADGSAWVVLNAVAKDLRGRGLYNCLLAHGLAWLKEQGAGQARVRTKLSQRAVIKAWSKLGAAQAGSDMTFHLWLNEA
jgi:GNAT superfamily N-acetyltransferase